MELVEDLRLAVFDELVRPADALHAGGDACIVEVLDAGSAEAIGEDVILEGAEHLAAPRDLFQEGGVEGLMKRGFTRETENPFSSSSSLVRTAMLKKVPRPMSATSVPSWISSPLPRWMGAHFASAGVPAMTPRG